MLATIPHLIADHIIALRPQLKKKPLPFEIQGSGLELLWPVASDDDGPSRFLRSRLAELAKAAASSPQQRLVQ